MGDTKIDWTDKVWNPVTGCTAISEGCEHCYAKRMAPRLRGRYGYPEDDPFRVYYHNDRMPDPMRWRKPRKIFVCSMGDLFHHHVTDGVIQAIWGIMSRCSHHTFMVLTKRPERALSLLSGKLGKWKDGVYLTKIPSSDGTGKPLPNVWLGVTAENQARYDERWAIASQIPAAKLFVSGEPLLGGIDFTRHAKKPDWFIVGGETGPGARPMNPDWVRKVRDDCRAAGVPFFFKQWGEWVPWKGPINPQPDPRLIGEMPISTATTIIDDVRYYRVGKKAAGHLLDGIEYREFPRS